MLHRRSVPHPALPFIKHVPILAKISATLPIWHSSPTTSGCSGESLQPPGGLMHPSVAIIQPHLMEVMNEFRARHMFALMSQRGGLKVLMNSSPKRHCRNKVRGGGEPCFTGNPSTEVVTQPYGDLQSPSSAA